MYLSCILNIPFLLNLCSGKQVVSELRNGLDLHSSLPPNSASTPANARKSFNANDANSGRDSKMLTLDAIYSAIKFNRHIGDAWLKVSFLVTEQSPD